MRTSSSPTTPWTSEAWTTFSPERPRRAGAHGVTPAEDAAGETLDERLEQEEPDPAAAVDHTAEAQEDEILEADDYSDPTDGFEVGDERTGRLTQAEGENADDVAEDVGVDGAAASAEEAAVHTIEEDQP